MCNFMKGKVHVDVYIKMILHILTRFLIIPKLFTYPEVFPNRISGNFNDYKNSAFDRNKQFELTKDEFDSLVVQDCYLCSKETNSLHINGIDRHNNDDGYNIKNCFACCSTCNYLKNKFDLNKMLEKFYLTACNLCKKEIQFEDFVFNNIKTISKIKINMLRKQNISILSEITKENNNLDISDSEDDETIVKKPKIINNIKTDVIDDDENTTALKRKRKTAIEKQIYRYKNLTDVKSIAKYNNALIELEALLNDPNYNINNYKKNAMTDVERQQKHRAKLDNGKIKKVPKTGAQRIKEYRNRKNQNTA